mgnify:CR=1 FL=1
MLAVVGLTVGWVVVAGLWHFSFAQAFDFPPSAYTVDRDARRTHRRGGAAGDVRLRRLQQRLQHRGGDPRSAAERSARDRLCRSSSSSALYIVMSTVIIGVIPWTEAQQTRAIASVFIERTFASPAAGRAAAVVMTALILFVTASSLYGVILGYSRIPFAAAREGQFFRIFARVHPTKHFPHVSLVTLGRARDPVLLLFARSDRQLADPRPDRLAVHLAVRRRHPAAALPS